MNEYLYHYTSIETLALILKNRTIRFNNLLNVDDPEEAETKDLGLSGKHCLVSCWTKSSEDTLPMWNMYTPRMKGVRIKMKMNPFKKYTYNKGDMYFSEKTLSCIDYKGEYVNKVTIAAECPITAEVVYTNDEEVIIDYSIRSPLKSARDELAMQLDMIASLFNGYTEKSGDYPGWDYDPHSLLRKQLKDFYKEYAHQELKEIATHGGLETGVFKGKIPELDIVTIGPNMADIHTPDERLDIQSFVDTFELLVKFIETL